MTIKLNPCEACIKKYQSGNCDIRNVSDCCYTTLAAFAGETSMNAVRNGSASDDKGLENCKKCVSQFISKMGRTLATSELNLLPYGTEFLIFSQT